VSAVIFLPGCYAEYLLPTLFYSMYSWLINDDDKISYKFILFIASYVCSSLMLDCTFCTCAL